MTNRSLGCLLLQGRLPSTPSEQITTCLSCPRMNYRLFLNFKLGNRTPHCTFLPPGHLVTTCRNRSFWVEMRHFLRWRGGIQRWCRWWWKGSPVRTFRFWLFRFRCRWRSFPWDRLRFRSTFFFEVYCHSFFILPSSCNLYNDLWIVIINNLK